MLVTVTKVWDPASTGSVTIAEGYEGSRAFVRFAGDTRPMADIAAALADGEEVEAEVPEWALLLVDPCCCAGDGTPSAPDWSHKCGHADCPVHHD